jgi:UDP-N-acetylglucosamine/UDP-N-acetylgalactosamine diphosphorylase
MSNAALLIDRGVRIINPGSVYVGPGVDPERIAAGVTVYPGCRLSGRHLSIGPGCVLGEEQPATVMDCQLAADVDLKGGFFSGATFMAGVSFGSGAHVRPGTLLEEQASCAHSVGLKQTVLMPFVTVGSLINFCDCLMAGGTSRVDHSEVGSSYIHFNYTPHRDKATPSLIGDVPSGVMLDNSPIFLGGQGGMVGPARVAYGTVVAAGTILRRDQLKPGQLIFGHPGRRHAERGFVAGAYGGIGRVVANNLIYIGNIHALRAWYLHVRARFCSTPHEEACLEGALVQFGRVMEERLYRMTQLADRMPASIEAARRSAGGELPQACQLQQALARCWPGIAPRLELKAKPDVPPPPEPLSTEIDRAADDLSYLDAVRGLSDDARVAGTAWLEAIVESVGSLWPADRAL